jgi:hypothetical protein
VLILDVEVPGILWEEVFHTGYGRKAIKFMDTVSGFTTSFPLTDGPYSESTQRVVTETLALTFLLQCSAYRASMRMVEQAMGDAQKERGPLDEVIKGDK